MYSVIYMYMYMYSVSTQLNITQSLKWICFIGPFFMHSFVNTSTKNCGVFLWRFNASYQYRPLVCHMYSSSTKAESMISVIKSYAINCNRGLSRNTSCKYPHVHVYLGYLFTARSVWYKDIFQIKVHCFVLKQKLCLHDRQSVNVEVYLEVQRDSVDAFGVMKL